MLAVMPVKSGLRSYGGLQITEITEMVSINENGYDRHRDIIHRNEYFCVFCEFLCDDTKVQHFEMVLWSYGEIRGDNER